MHRGARTGHPIIPVDRSPGNVGRSGAIVAGAVFLVFLRRVERNIALRYGEPNAVGIRLPGVSPMPDSPGQRPVTEHRPMAKHREFDREVTVYVWRFLHVRHVGHAAVKLRGLTTAENAYISWWPEDEEAKKGEFGYQKRELL